MRLRADAENHRLIRHVQRLQRQVQRQHAQRQQPQAAVQQGNRRPGHA